jgi:hypothetical protein
MELFLNENLLFNKNPTIKEIQIANACDISLDILPNSTKTHVIEKFVKSIAVITIKKILMLPFSFLKANFLFRK